MLAALLCLQAAATSLSGACVEARRAEAGVPAQLGEAHPQRLAAAARAKAACEAAPSDACAKTRGELAALAVRYGDAHPKMKAARAAEQVACRPALRVVRGRGYEGVIFPKERAEEMGVDGEAWTPSPAEVATLERALAKAIPELAAGGATRARDHLPEFIRQYAGVVVEGRKLIEVHGFAKPVDRWQDGAVVIDDGDCGVWHIRYDTSAQRFADFACGDG